MSDMKMDTRYMGLNLKSPIVVSACTLSEQTDNIAMMEDHGAGAVVLFSLFEEQIRDEEAQFKGVLSGTTFSFAEALDSSLICFSRATKCHTSKGSLPYKTEYDLIKFLIGGCPFFKRSLNSTDDLI